MLGHRWSFWATYGWLPKVVGHHCDNPPCIEPAHLFGGTQVDNMRDCVAKGRWGNRVFFGDDHWSHRMPDRVVRGEDHGCHKLTAEQVSEIRGMSCGSIEAARRYGISYTHLKRLRRGVGWSHLERVVVYDEGVSQEQTA